MATKRKVVSSSRDGDCQIEESALTSWPSRDFSPYL